MADFKEIVGVLSIVLVLVAYVPYIRDIFRNRTTPHTFSWFVWGSAVTITYALQITNGAGAGAWVTLGVALIAWFIFILGLFKKDKDIKLTDVVFLIAALLALYLWIVEKQPEMSSFLIVSVDVLGFIPTVRKSWNKPYSETLFSYELHTFRHALSILALAQYNFVTLFYPIVWTAVNGLFALFLTIRRRKVAKPLTES